jgi:hypothetical protein
MSDTETIPRATALHGRIVAKRVGQTAGAIEGINGSSVERPTSSFTARAGADWVVRSGPLRPSRPRLNGQHRARRIDPRWCFGAASFILDCELGTE